MKFLISTLVAMTMFGAGAAFAAEQKTDDTVQEVVSTNDTVASGLTDADIDALLNEPGD